MLLYFVLLIELIIVPLTTSFSAEHVHVDDLTSDELRQTFGVSQAEHVPKHRQLHPQAIFRPDGSLEKLLIDVGRESHELDFHSVTDQLISPHMVSVYRHGEHTGHLRVGEKPADCHFHHKSNHTYAAVSTCDGNLKGVIMKPWGAYVLHPFPERHQQRFKRSEDGIGLHVLYKREIANPEEQEFCGIKSTVTSQELLEDESAIQEDVFVVGERLTRESELVVELALFIDAVLWARFQSKHGGAAEQKLQDYAMTMLNNIQIMYHQPSMSPKLHFKVVRYEILKQQPSELAGNQHANGHAQTYLDRFCRYQRKIGNKNWDHAFLLSGYDIHRGYGSKAISGIARLFGMCDAMNTCTLTEGLDFTSAFIGTHELGHSVGMRHDEPYCTSKYIMSASLGPGKVTWSTCAMRDYHAYMDKLDHRKDNCLRKTNIPEVKYLDGKTQPGQVYDGDKQCTLMHGNGYKQVSPHQDNYDGVCYMMWCGQSQFGRIITSHPALEGTFCGHQKWCQLGRCVSWSNSPATAAPSVTAAPARPEPPKPTPVAPQVVNGGWSDWSSVTCSTCSCSSLAGGLGVLQSKRTCSRPTPLNGGRECEGSERMAIVCANECTSNRQSIDDYITSMCTKHRSTKNDNELTGTGTQLTRYPQRACKVFCDVKGELGTQRNYRFYGDNLPDGTPCGGKRSDRFCLDGECLPLSCDGHALVHGDVGCPSQKCPLASNSVTEQQNDPVSTPSAVWSGWSVWSDCSASCGGGTKRRGRSCSSAGLCQGDKAESESCNLNACASSAWLAWGTWSVCAGSCGSGRRSRTRYCSGEECSGTPTEQEACSAGLCPWGAWGLCSAQCGGGTRRRTRLCPSGDCNSADSYEDAKCNQHQCDTWTSWTTWSSCSLSCGTAGVQSRRRFCSGPKCTQFKETDDKSCNQIACPSNANNNIWSEWTLWSTCSTNCGSGIQTRIRSCPTDLCDGSSNERKTCNLGACSDAKREIESSGAWTSWSSWGPCSSVCGEGTRRRQRSCNGADGSCPGEAVDVAVCQNTACGGANWGGWGYWSSCSASCGSEGVQRRVRMCYGNGSCDGDKHERRSCPGPNC